MDERAGFDTRAMLDVLARELAVARAAGEAERPELSAALNQQLARLGAEGDLAVVASALRVHLDARAFEGLVDPSGKPVREAALEALVATAYPAGVPHPAPEPAPTERDLRELWSSQRTLIVSVVVMCLGLGRILFRMMQFDGPIDLFFELEALRWDSILVVIGGYGLFGDRVKKKPDEGWFGPKLRSELAAVASVPLLVEAVMLASRKPVDWLLVGGCALILVALTPWRDDG